MPDFQQISEHIHRLELPFHIVGPIHIPVAVWLVRTGAGWTLIDTGPPDAADQLVSALARATGGRGPNRVLLTHAHYDHAGGLESLREAWNPALICHRDEVPFVTGEKDYRRLKAGHAAFWFGRLLMRRTSWSVPVARDVERGEAVDGMAVIHLSGHSPGQVGFLHPQDHAMICGDALMNLRGRLSPPLALMTQDPKRAHASMQRLVELDYEHLLPSHGEPLLRTGRESLLAHLEGRELEEFPTRW